MTIQTINPATEQPITTYELMSAAQVDQIIQRAHQTFIDWRAISFEQRGQLIQLLAQNLLADKQRYASIITQEMGKPIRAAVTEVEKCAWVAEHYAQHAAEYLQPRIVAPTMTKVMSAINPWAWCWQSCRGITHSGKCFAMPCPL